MKTGSSFSAGGRSSRMPRPRAIPAARWSTSKRSSTWSETKPTGTEITSRTPRARQLLEVLAEVRPRPRLRRASGRLVRPRPAIVRETGSLRDQASRLEALLAVRVAGREHALGEAVRAEDDVHALALLLRPAREPLLHARRERRDEPGSVVVARDVLEVDPAAGELEPVRDLLLVARDRERAEVRREDEAHRIRDAVLDHLADDVLDPRRPVPHAEVAAEPVSELGRERVDLTLRDGEERRASPDRAVVLGDLVDHGARASAVRGGCPRGSRGSPRATPGRHRP